MSRMTAYGFSFPALTGGDIRLAEYAGRPLLVVNTASLCGFTPQYAGLQELWTEFRGRGLVIIGVPSNDFGGQEPGGATEIAQTAQHHYGVTFPIAAKAVVKGSNAHPFYKWAAEARPKDVPRWNFHKYLIGRDGYIAEVFPGKRRTRGYARENRHCAGPGGYLTLPQLTGPTTNPPLCPPRRCVGGAAPTRLLSVRGGRPGPGRKPAPATGKLLRKTRCVLRQVSFLPARFRCWRRARHGRRRPLPPKAPAPPAAPAPAARPPRQQPPQPARAACTNPERAWRRPHRRDRHHRRPGLRLRAFQAARLPARQGSGADLRRRPVAGQYAVGAQGAGGGMHHRHLLPDRQARDLLSGNSQAGCRRRPHHRHAHLVARHSHQQEADRSSSARKRSRKVSAR